MVNWWKKIFNGVDEQFYRELNTTFRTDQEVIHSQNRKLSLLFVRMNEDLGQFSIEPIEANLWYIYGKIFERAGVVRSENKDDFEQFQELLRKAMEGSSNPERQLLRVFNRMLRNVGEIPSWGTILNIVNCIHLTINTAKQYFPEVDEEYLKVKMQRCLEKYLNSKFTEFLNEMGGWDDYLDYHEAVSQRFKPETEIKSGISILPVVFIGGLAIFILYI